VLLVAVFQVFAKTSICVSGRGGIKNNVQDEYFEI
jgi:hypothetical protein